MAQYISFQPSDYFDASIYTGNNTAIGSGGKTVTGVGFQADWSWIKSRTSTSPQTGFDSVRGGDQTIYINSTSYQSYNAEGISTWNADGFVTGNSSDINASQDYISWNHKAGTTSGITTNGSTTITPASYSFNQTSGFSIVQYEGNATSGAKVAHGLGAVPQCIIVKDIDSVAGWFMYHKNMRYPSVVPWEFYMQISSSAADSDSSGYWNDTAPDDVNFTLGNNTDTNKANSFIAYCFAEKPGYSSFGGYKGNGNADGTFVYTGFQPAYVMIKTCNNSGQNWNIYDNARPAYVGQTKYLEANATTVEGTASAMHVDFLSNGFKPRDVNAGVNGTSYNYIYMAFAQFPFVSSNDIPCTGN